MGVTEIPKKNMDTAIYETLEDMRERERGEKENMSHKIFLKI